MDLRALMRWAETSTLLLRAKAATYQRPIPLEHYQNQAAATHREAFIF